jgi:hypothetical protein
LKSGGTGIGTGPVAFSRKRRSRVFVTGLLGMVLLPLTLYGQEFVWSVPSADVLEAKKMAVELYGSVGTANPLGSSLSPRFILGAGHGLEFGANFTANVSPLDSSTLDLAWKWRAYDGKANGWSVLLGGAGYIPILHRTYRFSDYSYVQASKTFRHETRLTAGPNLYTPGAAAAGAFRSGVQVAAEQPLGRIFGVSGDWISGRHSAGYTTFGAYATVRRQLYFSVGYALGNTGVTQGNQYLLLAVTVYGR